MSVTGDECTTNSYSAGLLHLGLREGKEGSRGYAFDCLLVEEIITLT